VFKGVLKKSEKSQSPCLMSARHARIASGGCARGEADEPVRKPLVRAVFAVVRRQDGGSPCGGRGATAFCWVLCAVRQ